MATINYILNDGMLYNLITMCLYDDSATIEQKKELENQIDLMLEKIKKLEGKG